MSIQNFEKPLFINCTPFNDNNNRILKWNSYGIVRHFKNNDINQINIKWWQTEIHSTIEFPNDKEYCYADISSNAVLFASNKLLHCIHFNKTEENEWTIHLNKGEQIRAICLGDNFIVIGTNNRNLRFFSLNGTQHQLISIPGPILCIISSNRTVVIVYHRMLPLPDNQSLDAMILDIDLESKLLNLEFSPINLPITIGSNLRWIGFTDEGTLALFDSSGSLKLFKNNLGLNWIEAGNLYQQVDDNCENIFIISITDLLEEIRCILCFKTRYPSPESLPVMQNLKFKLNLCKTTDETNELMEKNILSNIKCSMLNSLVDHDIATGNQIKDALKEQVDSLFKLFQDGGKNQNEMRQLDSAKLIPSLKTIENLLKYSEQSRLIRLVPKLNELIETKKTNTDEAINLFTALPTKQSTLQKLEFNNLNDEITPLIINKSIFNKSTNDSINVDTILDQIPQQTRYDLIDLNNEQSNLENKIMNDEEDELLKEVVSNEINTSSSSLKNPFKI